jgi:hypothetical protein
MAAQNKVGQTLAQRLVAAVNHPEHGWKTTHFWGPVANWGLVGAAVYDASFKGPEIIDLEITGTMIGYSSLFMGFAWQVQPRNLLLFSCHAFNVVAQANQLRRGIEYKLSNSANAKKELTDIGRKAAVAGCALSAMMGSIRPIRTLAARESCPGFLRNLLLHPAGPLTVFFWAPTSKWFFSVANLKDLKKPTKNMSIAQMTALTATGVIWTRYSFVINPINYNLAIVNLALGASSGYHLGRKLNNDYLGGDC